MFWAQEQKILKYFYEGRRNSTSKDILKSSNWELGWTLEVEREDKQTPIGSWLPNMLPCVLPFMLPYMLPCVEIWWKEKASWELVALCPPVPWEFWPIYGALLV